MPSLRLFRGWFLLLVACQLASCHEKQECDAVGIAAAVVTVVDSTGVVDPRAVVTFSFDGGAPQTAICTDSPSIPEGCSLWAVYTRAGQLLIQATSGDGTKKAEQSVEIVQDGCVLLGQKLTLTLH
jgi:hypothetical protein